MRVSKPEIQAAPETRTRAGALVTWAIRLVTLAAFMDLYMQLPVIATYAKSLGAVPEMIGVTVGMYSAANLLGNLGAGLLLDRLNRKRLVVAGMVLTAASLYAYAFVESPEQLLALRAAHGLCAGVLAPGAFAMLGDRDRGQQARSMGTNGSLIGVAATIGPAAAGIISARLGAPMVFATSGTFMLMACAVFCVLAPQSSQSEAASRDDDPTEKPPFIKPVMLLTYLATLAMTFGVGAQFNYLPILIEIGGGAENVTGMIFTTFSIVAIVVMAFPIQSGMDYRSRALTVVSGLVLFGVSALALGAFGIGIVAAFPAMALCGLGFGLIFPSLAASVSENAGIGRRGAAFGVFYAIYSFGVFVGTSVSGFVAGVIDNVGAPFYLDVGAPFYLSAAVSLLAAPIGMWIRRAR